MYLKPEINQRDLTIRREGNLSADLRRILLIKKVGEEERHVCLQDLTDIPFVEERRQIGKLGLLAVVHEIKGCQSELINHGTNDLCRRFHLYQEDAGELLGTYLQQQIILPDLCGVSDNGVNLNRVGQHPLILSQTRQREEQQQTNQP